MHTIKRKVRNAFRAFAMRWLPKGSRRRGGRDTAGQRNLLDSPSGAQQDGCDWVDCRMPFFCEAAESEFPQESLGPAWPTSLANRSTSANPGYLSWKY
jgi:hypothetical protein